MENVGLILILLAMGGALAALFMGMFNLVSTQEGHAKKSNRLMQWRVFFQALALAFFSILLLTMRK